MAARQRVVVMRHGDRLDHAEPMWLANKPRPWDPPLTDAGILRAWTVGKRIRAQAAADGYQLHRVLVSPFFRCLQTAGQAVAALCAVPDDAALAAAVESSANVPLDTSRVKVSIEYGLSEMMNAEAMGVFVSQVAPSVDKWFPDLAELEAVLPTGTIDHSTEPLYPEVPKWGESVRGARTRYASVIKALADKYPDENLLLITHGEFEFESINRKRHLRLLAGEAVGSSVACFGTGVEVYDVEYCAYSLLKRQPQVEGEGESLLKLLTDRSGPTTGIHYLLP